MTVEEKIEHYSALTEEERRDLEQYVSEHRVHAAALEEARQWDVLLRAAATLRMRPPSDEVLAFYAVMRGVDVDKMPADRADAFVRIEEAVARSPELQRRLEAFERRGADLAGRSDAAAQFERLSSEKAAPDPADRGASGAGPSKRTRWLRTAAAATVAVATAYAVLLLASQLTRPTHEKLASFEASELSIEGFRDVRGRDPAGTTSDATSAYLSALEQLRGAESSFLGLFPNYDAARLEAAEDRLQNVIDQEPEDSFLANEAQFLLGKVKLAEGDLAEARTHLQHVVAARGRLQAEAAAILEQLDIQ